MQRKIWKELFHGIDIIIFQEDTNNVYTFSSHFRHLLKISVLTVTCNWSVEFLIMTKFNSSTSARYTQIVIFNPQTLYIQKPTFAIVKEISKKCKYVRGS